MMWFLALLIVLMIGGVVVVTTGAGAAMAEEYDDRPDVRVQADGPLTADDLRAVRFTTAVRGYRASEVDSLLARLSRELEGRSADGAPAPEVARVAAPVPESAFRTIGPGPGPLPIRHRVRQA